MPLFYYFTSYFNEICFEKEVLSTFELKLLLFTFSLIPTIKVINDMILFQLPMHFLCAWLIETKYRHTFYSRVNLSVEKFYATEISAAELVVVKNY